MNGAALKLKMKTCFVFIDSESTVYVGHTVHSETMEVATKTPDATCSLNAQTNIYKLHSFNGYCNVFKHFASTFSKKVTPLKTNLKKRKPKQFELDKPGLMVTEHRAKEHKTADFNPPQHEENCFIHTATCDRQVRCVSEREQKYHTLRPI